MFHHHHHHARQSLLFALVLCRYIGVYRYTGVFHVFRTTYIVYVSHWSTVHFRQMNTGNAYKYTGVSLVYYMVSSLWVNSSILQTSLAKLKDNQQTRAPLAQYLTTTATANITSNNTQQLSHWPTDQLTHWPTTLTQTSTFIFHDYNIIMSSYIRQFSIRSPHQLVIDRLTASSNALHDGRRQIINTIA